MANGNELDVARRAKLIEWLKTELIGGTAQLSKGLWEGSQTKIIDGLSCIILSSYVLARRIGVSYRDLDAAVLEKVNKHKQDKHQVEEWYGDLSALERHLDGR